MSHESRRQKRAVILVRYQRMQTTMAAHAWCGKVAYFDKKGAKAAQRRKPENRIYRCPLCHHWHLTSQPMRQEVLP